MALEVLSALRPDLRRVVPRLAAAVPDLADARPTRDALDAVLAGGPFELRVRPSAQVRLDEPVVHGARELLGRAPRFVTSAWPSDEALAVEVARAVAACVPLAVLVAPDGQPALVHPQLGLVGRAEYEAARRGDTLEDFLRRLLGRD